MSDAVTVYETLPRFAQQEIDDFIYFVSARVKEGSSKQNADISGRMKTLESLQKFRGRLSPDFDAETELAEARLEKYGS